MPALHSSSHSSPCAKHSVMPASRFAQGLHSPKHNHLLASLPAAHYGRLLPHLELATMKAGDVLQQAGVSIDWVYFPTTSVVCLGYITASGSSPAVGLTGNDGIIGLACVMGGDSSSTQAIVQSAGYGYRIRASLLKQELQRNSELLRIALLYTQAFFTQVSQTAVCNRLHSVDQQFCRWLLMSVDRLGTTEIHLTHESIATMLGVRREGVTQAAGRLQAKGYIQYSRGEIHILNHPAIEQEACECYAAVNGEYERLLHFKLCSPVAPTQAMYVSKVPFSHVHAHANDAE